MILVSVPPEDIEVVDSNEPDEATSIEGPVASRDEVPRNSDAQDANSRAPRAATSVRPMDGEEKEPVSKHRVCLLLNMTCACNFKCLLLVLLLVLYP